jgi:WD40 repeat protein
VIIMSTLPHIHQISLNSGDDQNATYILDMDVSCDASSFAVASAGAGNTISIYDPQSGACLVPALSGHKDVIHSVTFSSSSPFHLMSASEDQTVCLFDCRASTQPTAQITLDSIVYSASLGMGDNLIAVGAGSSVSFYDSRNLATPLGSYADCHSDTVLKVKFHPVRTNVLHSAGEDGLICTYDTGVAAEVIIQIFSHLCLLVHM